MCPTPMNIAIMQREIASNGRPLQSVLQFQSKHSQEKGGRTMNTEQKTQEGLVLSMHTELVNSKCMTAGKALCVKEIV